MVLFWGCFFGFGFFLEFEPVLIEGGGGVGVDKLIKVKLQNLFSSVLFILLNGESG